MTPAHRSYLLRETAVAVGINSVLSLVFALLADHGRPVLPLWGASGMALDFVPQLFMMTFATTLAVTLLTRRRRKGGGVALWGDRPPPVPNHALARAVLFGLVAVAVLAPLSIAILALAGETAAPALPFIVGKVVYGALVSLLIAPLIILAALGEREATPSSLSGDRP